MSIAAVHGLLSKYDYQLIEIELFDEQNVECANCEHNAWFVKKSLLKSSTDAPLSPIVEYVGMVMLYWQRLPECMHFKRDYCPVKEIRTMQHSCDGKEDKDLHGFTRAVMTSLSLSMTSGTSCGATANSTLDLLQAYMKEKCPLCLTHGSVDHFNLDVVGNDSRISKSITSIANCLPK